MIPEPFPLCVPLADRPEIGRTIDNYRRGCWRAFRRGPLRQSLRVVQRRAREARQPHRAQPAHLDERTVPVPDILRSPPYRYRGFNGPWLEEHFYSTWTPDAATGAAYVPILFDSFFFHAQYHAFLPHEFAQRYRTMWQILGRLAAEPRPFFTLLGMYEFPIWEWHLFPRNVIVAAAAGYGDIAIPLLKGDWPRVQRPKDIRVSFMGALGGPSNVFDVRGAMVRTFKGCAHLGEGPEWRDVMERSDFTLCPRGQGPTSFRLFEALGATSIPVYLWRDHCWLPFTDELNWSEFALVVEAGQMDGVREQILRMPAEKIQTMQRRIGEIYDRYFRYDAACAQIRRRMAAIADRAAAEELTANRIHPGPG